MGNKIECLVSELSVHVIVAHWKFDVLKTSIFTLEASLLGYSLLGYSDIRLKNIKLPRGNYQPIVLRQKHSIV